MKKLGDKHQVSRKNRYVAVGTAVIGGLVALCNPNNAVAQTPSDLEERSREIARQLIDNNMKDQTFMYNDALNYFSGYKTELDSAVSYYGYRSGSATDSIYLQLRFEDRNGNGIIDPCDLLRINILENTAYTINGITTTMTIDRTIMDLGADGLNSAGKINYFNRFWRNIEIRTDSLGSMLEYRNFSDYSTNIVPESELKVIFAYLKIPTVNESIR